MDKIAKALFAALRSVLVGEALCADTLATFDDKDWQQLYAMASVQGVSAIVFEALSSDSDVLALIPRAVKMQWALKSEKVERRYERQLQLAGELATAYKNAGLTTYVLKGFALSRYYPTPAHRECGDFDCFIPGGYEDGNKIAVSLGASYEDGGYKHSHITYKGLMVENHRFCTPIRGSREGKRLERYLQSLLAQPYNYLYDTPLVSPSPTFNALFLMRHSMTHFLYEGIHLRHIVDWAMFLANEQCRVDWKAFYDWCDELGLTRFANTLNAVVNVFIGVDITNRDIVSDSSYAERIVKNILYEGNSVYNKRHKTVWHQRLAIVRNMLENHWKFRHIYRRSMLAELLGTALGNLLDRRPTL